MAPDNQRSDGLREGIDRQGYAGPIRFLSDRQCRRICKLIYRDRIVPQNWGKGKAVTSRLFYELATLEPVLDSVCSVLGEDVILWGASVVTRVPGQSHPWHTDIETAQSNGSAISVWIGLKHTNQKSSLSVVPGSHKFGTSIQEEAARHGKEREEISEDLILKWVQARAPDSQVTHLDIRDGEGILFDGRLWHGSLNRNRLFAREALLLQYARPENPIRIPDFRRLEYPFYFEKAPRPPCIVVSGEGAENSVNHLVPPPPDPRIAAHHRLSTFIRSLGLPLEEDTNSGWKACHLFRGSTTQLADLSCHMSILSPASRPHELHSHSEEEILIMLSGEANLEFENTSTHSVETRPLRPGSLVYYPRGAKHMLATPGSTSATYLMFKWKGRATSEKRGVLETSFHNFEAGFESESRPFRTRVILEGGTSYLRRLHCHLTELDAGAGYPPHVDAYDVAILLLSGEIETLDERIRKDGVVFYAAGEAHGMRNVGDLVARYLVFEFHSRGEDFLGRSSLAISDWKQGFVRWVRNVLLRFPVLKQLVRKGLEAAPSLRKWI